MRTISTQPKRRPGRATPRPTRQTGFTHLAERDAVYRPTKRHMTAFALITVLLMLVGGQVGFFSSMLFEDRWLARAEVQYRGTAWTETQDVAIQSRSLVGPVAGDLGIPIKQFEERLSAGLVPGTQIIRVDYVSEDEDLALEVVSEVSGRYLGQASERTPQTIGATLAEELVDVEEQLEVAERRLVVLAGRDTAVAQVEQASTQALINSLRARKNDLETRLLENEIILIGEESNGLPVLVTEPFVFEERVFPRPKIFTAVGAGAGLLLGLIIVTLTWNRNSWRATRSRTVTGQSRHTHRR